MGLCGLVGLGTDAVHIHQLQRETDMTTTALRETERDSMRREDSSAQQCREFASLSITDSCQKRTTIRCFTTFIVVSADAVAARLPADEMAMQTHSRMHACMCA